MSARRRSGRLAPGRRQIDGQGLNLRARRRKHLRFIARFVRFATRARCGLVLQYLREEVFGARLARIGIAEKIVL